MAGTENVETLGENVIPSRYSLRIEPDMKTFRYSGEVKIEVKISKPVREISLNSDELKIKSASVSCGGEVHDAGVGHDSKRQRISLLLKKKVKGSASIDIGFEGYSNDKLYGFYRSKYYEGKKERHILTSQFEAANARHAFPCFDEPAFKAVFNLSLVVDKKLSCISNMPIKSETDLGDKKEVTFMSTPRMSSYLLYMGVGDFIRKTRKVKNTELGIVVIKGREKYTELGLDYGAKSLSFLEEYFGIRYPLPKLDLIAIQDFAPAGMENWGAIVFRESALLGDEKSAVATKQRIAEVVAHEIVHQWFGDLVTMKWWNDVWLNESFADYMSHKVVDGIFPSWRIMLDYLADTVGSAMAVDQLNSTHPISVEVRTPGEVDQIFDEISYNKGGSVLRMLESYAGKETFRKGLHIYLKKNSYSNAVKQDLWNAIGEAARKSKSKRKLRMPEVAASWIENEGYPAIHLEKRNGGVFLRQERFRLLGDGKGKDEKWFIPVTVGYPPGKAEESFLMSEKKYRIKLDKRSVMKLNYGQNGFYRSVYHEDEFDALGEMIKGNELEWRDAWGVENDLYALTKKGTYGLEYYLSFVDKYCFAAKHPLNSNVLAHLRGLFGMFYGEGSEAYERVRRLLREYSVDILKQVGWKKSDGEDPSTTRIRGSAVIGSGIAGDMTAIHKATKMFRSGVGIDPDIKQSIYGLVAWDGRPSEYRLFRSRYIKENLPEEKLRLLGTLGTFSDRKILKEALAFSLSKEVRYQDGFFIPAVAARNPAGKEIIWSWTKRNWPLLMGRFSSGTHMLARYVGNLGVVCNMKEAEEIRNFFENSKNMRDDIKRPVAEALEVMEINRRFMERNMNLKGEE